MPLEMGERTRCTGPLDKLVIIQMRRFKIGKLKSRSIRLGCLTS